MNRVLKSLVVSTVVICVPLLASKDNNKSNPVKKSEVSKTINSIWIESGSLTNLSKELIEQIKKDKSVAEDLPFYKLYISVKRDIKKGKLSAKLNKKIDKLYKEYINYLIKGGINWQAFDAHLERLKKKYDYNVAWEHYTPPYSAKKILNSAKINGTFGDIFNKVEPHRFKYTKLKSNLINFINIKHHGGWKVAKVSNTIRVGDSNPAIPIIRKRLYIEGDLRGCKEPMDSTVYDNCMAKAVKRFKLRHGFKGTSVIDRATRVEFRRSISYYIKKLRLNLDRIKWSKRKEAKVRIELNIPAFRLYIYDGKDLVTTMRVVTGKPNHPTPVFSDIMTTIVVNPYWRIPESIVKKEMIKHLIKNPHYYDKQHKYLYNGWGDSAKRVDPATVNWKKYANNKKHIPYHFMQSPSNKNALGKIKFLFPNKYSVYVHDTPSKKLFFRETRAFSHGCMRIQKPRELLKALSLYNSNINVDSIMQRLKTNKKKNIALRRQIPIDITYFTSFVDDYGNLHFRKDIYGYDRAQLKNYYKKFTPVKSENRDIENKDSNSIEKESPKKRKKDKSKTKKGNSKKIKNRVHTTKKKIKKPKKIKPKVKKPDYEVIEIGY